MSASLVGSEMCIRDSRQLQQPRKGNRARSWLIKPRARAPGAARERVSSVSYTHLTLPTICSV
eukprot:498044-Alexandrium_andersonii.AAC.1